MAIEDIFRALEEQAEGDCRDILDGAKAQAAALIEDAEAEAEQIKLSTVESAETDVRASSSHTLNAARLAAKKGVATIKGSAIDEAFDDARTALGAVRKDPSYAKLFGQLVDEALAGVDEEFSVLVDAADEKLAREVLAEKGVDAPVEATLETAGGLIIAMKGGRVTRRNTLEDRLDRLRLVGQARVAEILFGS